MSGTARRKTLSLSDAGKAALAKRTARKALKVVYVNPAMTDICEKDLTIRDVRDFFDNLTAYNKGYNLPPHWRAACSLDLGSRDFTKVMTRTAQAAGDDGETDLKDDDILLYCKKFMQYSLSDIDFRQISNVMHGLAVLRRRPPQAFIDFIMPIAEMKIKQDNMQGLTNLMWAFGRLGIEPTQKLTRCWSGQIKKKAEPCGDKSLVWADPAYCDQNISNALSGIATVTAQYPALKDDPAVQQVVERLRDYAETRKPEGEEHRQQIVDACLWFGLETTIQRPLDRSETMSQDEKRVRRSMHAEGIPVRIDDCIVGLDHRPDLSATFANADVLFECDGPFHFVRDLENSKTVLDGHTIYNTTLMHMQRPEAYIVRAPNDVIERATSSAQWPGWCQYLAPMARIGPGIYVANLDGPVPMQRYRLGG